MTKRRFSQMEIEYLRSLPAVSAVTENRITYARDFQIMCMHRYLNGERPSVIFTSAGLSPSIVGHKRVERNIARWKHDDEIVKAAKRVDVAQPESNTEFDHMVTLQMGKIQSLTCQMFALKERMDELERRIGALEK
ncbi:HTH domain-containing protein [Bifidobacterium sp. UBA6881]|uniref:HTH domain-containing protein n=1 Tax=Bifidobacterium sp. UBA6881 TaxID=1946109 RepID=UPI000EB992E8|nr:HTH domain-containing protein [Bifidobacterium sp. UBA6881]HCH21731.1 transposase [Bifidobacterium sp.]